MILLFYIPLPYFFVARRKKELSLWRLMIIHSGYLISLVLFFIIPFGGLIMATWIGVCHRVHKKRMKRESFWPSFLRFGRAIHGPLSSNHASKENSLLDSVRQENELKDLKIAELRRQNQELKNSEENLRKVSEATPRMRYYNEQAKQRIEAEDVELARLREKRLEEEIRKLKA